MTQGEAGSLVVTAALVAALVVVVGLSLVWQLDDFRARVGALENAPPVLVEPCERTEEESRWH